MGLHAQFRGEEAGWGRVIAAGRSMLGIGW